MHCYRCNDKNKTSQIPTRTFSILIEPKRLQNFENRLLSKFCECIGSVIIEKVLVHITDASHVKSLSKDYIVQLVTQMLHCSLSAKALPICCIDITYMNYRWQIRLYGLFYYLFIYCTRSSFWETI